MRRLLLGLAAVFSISVLSTSCEHTITKTEYSVDTLYVPKLDTLLVPVHDTTHLVRYDTTYVPRVDTVVSVKYDTTVVTRVDTIVRVDTLPGVRDTVIRVDTLIIPGQAIHDTTWLYTQTNPTNPFAGGDPRSGLLVLGPIYYTEYLVFWHGHFMGVLMSGGYGSTTFWNAYGVPTDGSIVMPQMCSKPTWQEAAGCLEPLVLTLSPTVMPLRSLR